MPRATYSGNTQSAPTFIGDFLSRDYLLPGGVKINAAEFLTEGSVKITVGANAAADATSVTVAALSGAIPNGAVIPVGAASSKKFMTLNAAAAAGATTLTVQPLVTALSNGDTGNYTSMSARKPIPAGTRIGRTFTERASNTPFGAAADADDEIFVVAYDIHDAALVNDAEVLREGTLIKENLLPGWTTETSTIKGKVRAFYQTTTGTGGVS